jgi:glutamine synthetase
LQGRPAGVSRIAWALTGPGARPITSGILKEEVMQAAEVRTIEDAKRLIKAKGLEHVKVGLFDHDGVLRGKYMSKEKFLSALENGFGLCDVVLGWDSNDQLYDNVKFTGWHTAYPDVGARVLPATCRDLPGEQTVFFLCEFEGRAEAICPRGLLRRMVDKAQAMGFGCTAALEYEFFVFDETPESVREKGYRNLKPITPGNFGYSVLRSSVWSAFYEQLLMMSQDMRLHIEGLHTETGPGVLEAALACTDALEAADRAALFKTFTKVLAQRNGMMATFMAKWSNAVPGQSGHLHMSLTDKAGKNVFFEDAAAHGMSEVQRHFVAGQLALLPELLSMISPTVNSFSRLVPGHWAPINATWGVENRTTALRVIPGGKKGQRVEFRIAAADANPYTIMAAALGAGLYGIERRLELPPPVEGNAYTQALEERTRLPATLWEAAQRLKGSAAARTLFGDEFVEHYAAHREWEEREFRKHITDWELQRYFEIM